MDFVKIILKEVLKNSIEAVIVGALSGGLIYYWTPNDNAMLQKFGVLWYIVFWAAVVYIGIILVKFIVKFITKKIKSTKSHKEYTEYQTREATKEETEVQNKLWHEVDNMTPDDRKILRTFIETENKVIERSTNEYYSYGSLLNSNWVISTVKQPDKSEQVYYAKPKPGTVPIPHMIFSGGIKQYKLKDDIYKALKYFYDKTGKICNFE